MYKSESILLGNGIHLPVFLELSEIGTRFNITKNKYMLFTGRLVPEKAVDVLIEAFKQIETQIKLVIVGDFAESKKYGRQLVNSCKGNDAIVFTSRLSGNELKQVYANALVYVSASRLEGNPLSVLEAMSHGLPLILSGIPAHEEILALYDDMPVFSFSVDDIDSCKNSINSFLKMNRMDVVELKSDSRRIVATHFSMANLVKETQVIYSRLTQKNHNARSRRR